MALKTTNKNRKKLHEIPKPNNTYMNISPKYILFVVAAIVVLAML